jgi:hypothetical protein
VPSKTEFVAGNHEGSILRLVLEERRILFFRDPWGRDSSSIPDAQFAITEALWSDAAFLRILQSYTPEERSAIEACCRAGSG